MRIELAVERARRWNDRFPMGTPVEVYRDNGETMTTRTRSHAHVVNESHVVVFLQGIAGYYDVGCVRPVGEGER